VRAGDDDTFDVMIDKIQAGDADFSINRFYVQSERLEKVDFIMPGLAFSNLKAMSYMKEAFPNSLERFFYPFDSFVWVLFPVFLLAFILALSYSLRSDGKSHDQADTEWIVIRTQLRGHNDTPFGRLAPVSPPAARGLAALRACFVCFSYY
jgi:hypothetical protein